MDNKANILSLDAGNGMVRGSSRRCTRKPGRYLWVVLAALLLASSTVGQTPTTPVLVTTFGGGGTLGIPRWKGYMSPTDPDKFWLSFANGGSSSNLCYTRNAGDTWSTNTINIDGYMDFHLSLFGRNDDLYFTFPSSMSNAIGFRRFRSPAESIADAGSLVTLSGTSANHRANITVQDNGRIWVFTRLGGSTGENVRYQFSDNGGSNWTTGMAYATGAPDIRIGSMPYVNGNPALVVLYLNDNRGYEYYLWNGSSFEARPDHSIYAFNPGYDRAFTHNQVNDSVLHLIFGQGNDLRHVWKNYAGGTGSWHTSVIMSQPNTGSIDWFPISTAQGDDLYLFYCRLSSSDPASKRVYYRKWSQTSQTWSNEYQVSTQSSSTDPNTCFHVPLDASYIPVFWTAGSNIYFSKVPVDPVATDTIPPGKIEDLGALPGTGPASVTLNWTATGDDYSTGSATSYDIRYATQPIDASNWSSAIPLGSTPYPNSAGQQESFTLSNLPMGLIYFAIRVWDEQQNPSPISNIALMLVTDVDDSDNNALLPEHTGLTSLWPNPFNAEAQIEYEVARAGPVELSVYNILGRRVACLVDAPQAVGSHQVTWNGTDSDNSPVASGIYFFRLVADDITDVRKIVLLK